MDVKLVSSTCHQPGLHPLSVHTAGCKMAAVVCFHSLNATKKNEMILHDIYKAEEFKIDSSRHTVLFKGKVVLLTTFSLATRYSTHLTRMSLKHGE